MNEAIECLKTTALGGFLVLLPILLLYLMLSEAFELVVAWATPLADLFPQGTFDRINLPVLVAFLLILEVSFALGLAASSELGRRFGQWLRGPHAQSCATLENVERPGGGLCRERRERRA